MTTQELFSSIKGDFLRLDAELVLSHLMGVERTWLVAHPTDEVPVYIAKQFRRLLARLEKHEPLAYLLGEVEFCGLSIEVNKNVLIPRPETEWLVERGLNILKNHPKIETVIDVGTGSGCIITSLYSLCYPTVRRRINWLATDISLRALAVAKKNAEKLTAAKIKFKQADLLTNIKLSENTLILANLPYLPNKDYKEAPKSVSKFEPKQALIAGREGLKFYRKLTKQIAVAKLTNIFALWEIDPCHSEQLSALINRQQTTLIATIERDYGGLDRYIFIRSRY